CQKLPNSECLGVFLLLPNFSIIKRNSLSPTKILIFAHQFPPKQFAPVARKREIQRKIFGGDTKIARYVRSIASSVKLPLIRYTIRITNRCILIVLLLVTLGSMKKIKEGFCYIYLPTHVVTVLTMTYVFSNSTTYKEKSWAIFLRW